MKKTRTLVTMGLLIAITVVLTELSKMMPYSNIVRISFAFIPVAACAILIGPVAAGVVAALADILGFFIFPTGSYFLGITLSALLSGILYGLMLYKRKLSVIYALIASALVCLFVDAGLTTFWIYFIMQGKSFESLFTLHMIKNLVIIPLQDKAFWVLFIPRLIKSLAMIPVQTFIIYALWRSYIKLRLLEKF